MFYSLFDYPTRTKVAVIILTHLAVIATGYCFLIRPQLRELQFLKQSRFLVTKDRNIDKQAYAKALKLLKRPVNINHLITNLTTLCQLNHLQLIRLEPKEKNKLLLVAQGNFLNLLTFLKNLTRLPHLFIIPKLQMQKESSDITLQCTIDVYHD